jgi:hypothetical protein
VLFGSKLTSANETTVEVVHEEVGCPLIALRQVPAGAEEVSWE